MREAAMFELLDAKQTDNLRQSSSIPPKGPSSRCQDPRQLPSSRVRDGNTSATTPSSPLRTGLTGHVNVAVSGLFQDSLTSLQYLLSAPEHGKNLPFLNNTELDELLEIGSKSFATAKMASGKRRRLVLPLSVLWLAQPLRPSCTMINTISQPVLQVRG
jgi:hypothetical protein